MNSVIATPKRRNVMGNLHYDYECKKTLTSLGKRINIDEEWVDSVNDFFGDEGYDNFLHWIKRMIRVQHNVEISDAQGWMLQYHILSTGVPQALRDDDVDEETNIVSKTAGAVADAVTSGKNTIWGSSDTEEEATPDAE